MVRAEPTSQKRDAGHPALEQPIKVIDNVLDHLSHIVQRFNDRLSGKSIRRLCIVGGGVKNEALNRLTERVTGIEVVRGPSESTAAGSIAVQIAALENAVSLEQIQLITAKLKFGSPQ